MSAVDDGVASAPALLKRKGAEDVEQEPWRVRLDEGDARAAWDLFMGRYRRLILATIRRLVDPDDVADAFAHVCQALAIDDLARLRRYDWHSSKRAQFSTWLVTVVHHQVIDWVRGRSGRRRVVVPDALTQVQREIFTLIFVERRPHAETFESLRASLPEPLSFSAFLKEVAETYRVVEGSRPRGAMHYFRAPVLLTSVDGRGEERVVSEERVRLVAAALERLSTEERAAVQLYVMEGMSAADVARTLAMGSAKAVYNRVYRALERLRALLETKGIGLADL